ncbi:hypothetical protein BGX28_000019 [Mortierella sp. GBA30]|nr:hypothetical protein BGX28_000019 [Mortierella sp. GBA30]
MSPRMGICQGPSIKPSPEADIPPTSPLDALVLALEATAQEMGRCQNQELNLPPESAAPHEEDEDPNATVPSSPTLFMTKTTNPDCTTSLQHLPALLLPAPSFPIYQPLSASTSATVPTEPLMASFVPSNLTPSSHPEEPANRQDASHRRTSVSSQGSIGSNTSVSSNGERSKTFACTIGNCEKKFYQVAHLRIHERCHTGTRPFVCRFDGCERSFTQLGNLKTHERKHTGERPYKCPHHGCDKTFTQLGNLKTHERIHDEVKPFMCRIDGCGKTFSQLGNLKTHTVKMHPDVTISDEELSIRTVVKSRSPARPQTHRALRPVQSKTFDVVQVVAHFDPYQRRPIQPQRSERALLLKEIQAMLRHQQRVRALNDGSEASDEMEE